MTDTHTSVPNPLSFADDEIAQAVLDRVKVHPNFFQRGESADAGDDVPLDGAPADDAVTSAVSADEVPAATEVATEPGVDAPSADAPSVDGPLTYTIQVDGQPVELTQAQIDGLLGLNAWSQKLDDSTREQFSHIENGRAIAVPTDEFAAYRAWRLQQDRQTATAQRTVPEWVDELDPEARLAFERQQAEIAQLRQSLAQQQAAPIADQHNQEMERRTAVFDGAMAAYGQANGFTDEQVGSLLDLAVRAGIVPTLVEAQRQYSPSGALVHDADLALVAKQALDFGRLQNPHLSPSLAPAAAPAPAPATAPAPPAIDPVIAKRARASTLSAAPSAATTIPTLDPRTLDISQQRTAIAEILRAQGIAS